MKAALPFVLSAILIFITFAGVLGVKSGLIVVAICGIALAALWVASKF